jgi:DNA polymerase III alpha subunit
LLLLAENETGYRNLVRLASRASLEGFYYRPRIDLDMLQHHHEGIIATSACLGGPVANPLLDGNEAKAREYAGTLAELFGKDRFYIEIQDHGLKEQLEVNRSLIPLAKSFGLPIVASNDVHYCNKDDAPYQDVLVCVQTNTTIHDPKRLKQETNEFFLKSPEQMAQLFGEIPDALSNTIRIAEMCNLDLGSRDITFRTSRFQKALATRRILSTFAGKAYVACTATTRARSASGWSMSSASSTTWDSPIISWWSGTSSGSPRRTESLSVRDAVRRPAAS